MDSKLLLVKCITLLYRESELSHTDSSVRLCHEVVETIKIPETSMSVQTGREVLVGLRSTLHWMMEHKEKVYDKTQLLQRVRINTKDDTYLYNAVVDAIQPLTDESELKTQILNYRKSLKDYLAEQQVNAIITQAFQRVSFTTPSNNDYRSFVREVFDRLEPFTHDIIDTRHPSVVDSIDFNDEASMIKLLQRSKDEISTDGVLRTGYQGINRMLGDTGGFRRGEMVVVGALQHNFKTGFTMNLFKHFALYNKPYMRDPSKKPLLIHFSLENELPMNIMWLYANLKENETGVECNVHDVDVAEAACYIRERMGVNGYHIEMIRLEPGQCSYRDLFDMVLKFEADGYEVHAIVCDYLNMMDKKGLDRAGPSGSDIRELFRRMRNFCAPLLN